MPGGKVRLMYWLHCQIVLSCISKIALICRKHEFLSIGVYSRKECYFLRAVIPDSHR